MDRLEFDEQPVAQLTLDTALENRAEQLGDDPFVFYGPEEEVVSYAEMNETANSIGNSLGEHGVEKQQKISVMVRHPLQTLFTFFGILKRGAVYSPINYEYKGQTLSYQLNDTRPEMLVLEDRYAGRLNEVKDDLEDLPHVVLYETDADSDPLDEAFPQSSFAELTEGDTTAPDVDVQWDDVASVLYTSGTTGDPKGVVQEHRWVINNYSEFGWRFRSPDDVVHTSLPLYHVGGLYADVVAAMIAGASAAMWDQFSPNEFWDRIEKYGASSCLLLSSMIPWLDNQPERDDDHRNTLNKVAMVPLVENHMEIAERFGFDVVFSSYGSTEIGNPLTGVIHAARGEAATPEDLQKGMSAEEVVDSARELDIPVVEEAPGKGWIGSADWKSEKMEVAVVNDRDEEVPPGEVGEFVARPKQPGILFREYDGKPEKTVESWRNFWFHSGDAMHRDEDGHHYFVDRIGTVIRRRGENISSGQVQDIVNSHEAVDRSAAFPVPAEEGGEDEVAVAVEVADGADLDEETLRAYLDAEMPEFMIPKYVLFLEEIPTTETNKMEKYKLREELQARASLPE